MLKAKPLETLNMEDSRGKCPRKRTRRSGVNYDESSDQDICHDFENDVLDTSRESVEVDDEISINPGLISEKVTRSPKDSHLKTEKWKYKTRKKRKKSENCDNKYSTTVEDVNTMNEKRVVNVVEEPSSVDNSVDLDLQALRTKYIKMNKVARQSEKGKKLYKILYGSHKLDSAGNSENHSNSSSEDNRRKKTTWKDQTVECDVCGKEMLRSRLKKHVMVAHKSKRLYPCDECSFNAENLDALKKHLRKRHKLSIETVKKMIKFIKMNRKHRMSVLEDEPEILPVKNRRLQGIGALKDELHQTDSELDKRTRGVAKCYKETSFDLDDEEQWNIELKGSDSDDDIENVSEDDKKSAIEKGNSSDPDLKSLDSEEPKEAVSGRESQASQDAQTPSVSREATAEEIAAGNDLLKTMKTLGDDEKANEGDRFYSHQQKDSLKQFFGICQYPTPEQRESLAEKLGIKKQKVYYWFDNTRRVLQKQAMRKEAEAMDTIEGQTKRSRKRPASPGLLAPKMRHLIKSDLIIEYDNSQIVKSLKTIDELIDEGLPVCIGVDLNPTRQRCLLCTYTSSLRGNLNKHVRWHGYEPKFCSVPREMSEISPDKKGCRKMFTLDSFDLHTCTAEIPPCFGDEVKIGSKPKSNRTGWESSDSDESSDDGNGRTCERVEELKGEGKPVALGFEVSDSCSKCLLCDVSTSVRGNLYKHINSHGYNVKFCSYPRENSELNAGNKGCRKIWLEESFEAHICTYEDPEQIGHYPLEKMAGLKKKKRRKGGFRGYEKNFGVPDGSPAKFYSDRYTRLFRQLGIRGNHSMAMDTTFRRNGKMELVYLTGRQMTAVKDYVGGSEMYFLVSELKWF